MLIVGIDPASNTAGIAIFDSETKELFVFEEMRAPVTKDLHKRLRALSELCSMYMLSLDPKEETYAFVESTVLRGRSGQVLANATGALIATLPSFVKYKAIQNTSVKRLVAGSGDADKVEVAKGVYDWAKSNPATLAKVKDAIIKKQFDKLDALAIGIAGYIKEVL